MGRVRDNPPAVCVCDYDNSPCVAQRSNVRKRNLQSDWPVDDIPARGHFVVLRNCAGDAPTDPTNLGMAAKEGEGEWPHHQILRAHRLYAFRQHLHIQDAVPYLLKRKAIPKSLAREISNYPLQKNDDYNINFLLAYLREAGVERFVRFIEGLGDSISPALGGVSKSHAVLIDTMSENLEKISNADVDQVRRVRAVLKLVRGLRGLEEEVEEGVEEDKGYGQSFEFLSPQMVTQSNTKVMNITKLVSMAIHLVLKRYSCLL